MKKTYTLDPNAAFPDATKQPSESELQAALGNAFAVIAEIETMVRPVAPTAEHDWKYSPQSGWMRIRMLKKRRLFYLIPKREAFRLMMILGGKALEALKAGPYAGKIVRLLKTAKRYPEGTGFEFGSDCDPKLVAAMVVAKIAH